MNFALPVWLYSVRSVSVGLLDPKNMGVDIGILSLGGIEPEIRRRYFLPTVTTFVCKK